MILHNEKSIDVVALVYRNSLNYMFLYGMLLL